MARVLLLPIIIMAVAGDFKTGRISNRLILAGLSVGLVCRICTEGTGGIITFFIHIILPVILLFLLFHLHALGAGDVKLFSIISSICSFEELGLCIAAAFIVGAVFVIAKIAFRKAKWGDTIHFAFPILIGYLVSMGVYL